MISKFGDYHQLYNYWKIEISTSEIQSLPLELISNFENLINDHLIKKMTYSEINVDIIERMNFLINNLVQLRKKKILLIVLNKKKIETSYLSKKEKNYYKILLLSEKIIENKSEEDVDLYDFLDEKSPLIQKNNDKLSGNSIHIQNTNIFSNTDSIKVKVRILKNIPSFKYKNSEILGPYKINELISLPLDLYEDILEPRKFAEKLI